MDLAALERSGAFKGVYHVLHGKLSPLAGVGPENLNLQPLLDRMAGGEAVDAGSALMIMTLGAGKGDEVTIETDDPAVLAAIAELVEKDLDA